MSYYAPLYTYIAYMCMSVWHTCTVNSVAYFSCQCQNVLLYSLSFLSNKCNKDSPGSLQTCSRALLSSCSHKNLKAFYSCCLPFLPNPALQYEKYVFFLHIEVSCKDNLDYSHLALRINPDSSNAGLAAVLSQSPDHSLQSLFRGFYSANLLPYSPTPWF